LIIYKQAFLIQKEQSARESRAKEEEESKGGEDEDRQSAN